MSTHEIASRNHTLWNAFEWLNITPAFRLQCDVLRHAYAEQQKRFHPDKWRTRSLLIQDAARSLSERIAQAFTQLNCPILRAEILFKIHEKWPLQDPDITFLTAFFQVAETLQHQSNAHIIQVIKTRNAEADEVLYEYFDKQNGNLSAATHAYWQLVYTQRLKDQ